MIMDNQHPNENAIVRNVGPFRDSNRRHRVIWSEPKSLFTVLWRSRWIVLLTTVVAVAAAFVYIRKTIPIYTSTSRIYVQQSGPKVLTGIEEGVMTQSKNYLYTQAELLKSLSILRAVFEDPSIRKSRTLAGLDNPIAHLGKKLKVSVGRKDDIIDVCFDSPYPEEAAQIVNSAVNAYLEYHASLKRTTSSEVLKILQSENAKRLEELREKRQTMLEFKKNNEELAFEGGKGNIVIGRLEKLSTDLTQAQLATIEYESVYESTKEMVSDPGKLGRFIEAQQTRGTYSSTANQKASLNAQLDELELRLANRLRQVNPDHPAAEALKSEIGNLKDQLANLDAEFALTQLAVAEQEFLAAKEKEEKIANYYAEQCQQAFHLSQQVDNYEMLRADWEQTKQLCDTLNDRIRELNVTEDTGALNVSVLEIARPARDPSKPQKARVVAIGSALGLMIGCGLALLRDRLDQKFHSTDEVSATLDLHVLGVVPSMRTRTYVARGQKVHMDSLSPAAEAYRTIRTAVLFSTPKHESKTIVVTSPIPGEGKTTLASNLAIATAQAGQKTLLFDADFRNPKQHMMFRVDGCGGGFSDAFTGAISLEEAILSTSVTNLDLLPCGAQVANASEVLGSDEFTDLLEQLAKRYDRIIIDSPPLMPVTDAQVLASFCDITILVLRAGKSNKKTCLRACEGLRSVNARLIGAVINDVSKKNDHYGYYSDYGDYSNYYGNGSRRMRRPHTKVVAATTKPRMLERHVE